MCSSRPVSPRNPRGFTLLEILMVMAIIALLAAITAPYIGNGLKSATFKTSVNRLMATMRYCRSRAISRKYTYHVTLSFEENGYQIDTKDPDIKGTPAEKKFKHFPEEVRLYEISDENDTYNQGQYQVSFFPKGNSTGEKILLMNHRERIVAVAVDQVTGRVSFSNSD
ncbi:MAG: Tfp pilus assembly protein FimT/FimU [bacterium]